MTQTHMATVSQLTANAYEGSSNYLRRCLKFLRKYLKYLNILKYVDLHEEL